MAILESIILGIIEGFTEFLPISSTAHLILAGNLLGIPSTDFVKTFEVAIQLGAILAVVVLYAKRLIVQPKMIVTILAAFVPTAIIGFALHDIIKGVFFENILIILFTMGLGGLALIAFETWHPKNERTSDIGDISISQAMIIGIAQSFAIVPGVSRAAATIVGGIILGISRTTIVEFSFLLAIPTMAAATGLDLLKTGTSFTQNEWMMLAVGFVTAFVTAMLAVRWFVRFLQRHTFTPFGIYRIIAAVAFALFLL